MSDASIEDLQTFFLLFQKLSSSDFANLDAYKQGDKMASGSNQMISLDPQSNAAKVARALSPINDQSDVSKDTAMRDELLKVLKIVDELRLTLIPTVINQLRQLASTSAATDSMLYMHKNLEALALCVNQVLSPHSHDSLPDHSMRSIVFSALFEDDVSTDILESWSNLQTVLDTVIPRPFELFSRPVEFYSFNVDAEFFFDELDDESSDGEVLEGLQLLGSLLPRMQYHLGHMQMVDIPDRKALQDRRISTSQNLSTVAIFLSSVTASTIQYTLSFGPSTLSHTLTVCWFLSLALSTGSAIMSQISAYWQSSPYAQPVDKMPAVMYQFLAHLPIALLSVSMLLFLLGIPLYLFIPYANQAIGVPISLTVAIALIVIIITLMALWLLHERAGVQMDFHLPFPFDVLVLLLAVALIFIVDWIWSPISDLVSFLCCRLCCRVRIRMRMRRRRDPEAGIQSPARQSSQSSSRVRRQENGRRNTAEIVSTPALPDNTKYNNKFKAEELPTLGFEIKDANDPQVGMQPLREQVLNDQNPPSETIKMYPTSTRPPLNTPPVHQPSSSSYLPNTEGLNVQRRHGVPIPHIHPACFACYYRKKRCHPVGEGLPCVDLITQEVDVII